MSHPLFVIWSGYCIFQQCCRIMTSRASSLINKEVKRVILLGPSNAKAGTQALNTSRISTISGEIIKSKIREFSKFLSYCAAKFCYKVGTTCGSGRSHWTDLRSRDLFVARRSSVGISDNFELLLTKLLTSVKCFCA